MFRIVRFGALMGALVTLSGGAMAEPLAIVGAKIYPARDAASIDDGVVVVEDGKIAVVGKRSKISVPQTAHVIDAHGAVLTAGFWNNHVHIMPAERLNAKTAKAETDDIRGVPKGACSRGEQCNRLALSGTSEV
jgi:imidazolonepropionase-like amidohydrolase